MGYGDEVVGATHARRDISHDTQLLVNFHSSLLCLTHVPILDFRDMVSLALQKTDSALVTRAAFLTTAVTAASLRLWWLEQPNRLFPFQ